MMGILKQLKVAKTMKGYEQIVDLVAEQCDLTQPIDPSDLENIHRLSTCLKHAIPYFSVSFFFLVYYDNNNRSLLRK